jgi:hypothetical protein
MQKIILSLFVALSLLIAPIAHASDMNCEGDNCQMSEQTKKQAKSEKQQDNDKMAEAGHDCCCSHVSIIPDLAVAKPMAASSYTAFVYEQDVTTSVVVGPPLKPPSHA